MNRKIIYGLFLFALLPSFLFAQGNGRIKGKVTDLSTGEALIGANVLVVGTSSGAATDVNGEFIILNLSAGTYSVKASYLGYQAITTTNLRVNSDLTTEIDIQLPSQDIAVEDIIVIAERPLIQKDATSSVRNVTSEDIKNLPVRGVNNIASLQAGVIRDNDGDIHIRGSRAEEVGYVLEGTSISDPVMGGAGITLSNDAVEELQVESGGFSAEYGGANAGIIRTQLKSGSSDYHFSLEHITDNIGFQSRDDFRSQDKRLGAYWYGNDETSFSLSGPVYGNKIKLFYNFSYKFDRSNEKKGYPGINLGLIGEDLDQTNTYNNDSINAFYPAGVREHNKRTAFTHSGSMTFDFKPINVRLSGTYTTGERDVTNVENFDHIKTLTNNRVTVRDFQNGSFTGKVTHVLDNKLFYEISGGYSFQEQKDLDPYLGANYWAYGDSVANFNAGVPWIRSEKDQKSTFLGLGADETRFQNPAPLSVFGIEFIRDGRVAFNHAKNRRETKHGRIDLSYLPNKHHSIKIGGEYKQFTIRNWTTRTAQRNFAGALNQAMDGVDPSLVKEKQAEILYAAGVNNYGYDIFGNQTEDGFYAPHKPVEAGIYLQDKIEFDDIILNIGLRYDYFDMDNLKLKDPTLPELAFTKVSTSGTLLREGFEEVKSFSSVSPRLSVSFPVTDKTVFHAGYGKYVQQPSLNQAYMGYHSNAYELSQSFFFGAPTGANLRPVRKTHYEVGFRQQLTDFLAVDISGYYDDINGQVYFAITDTDPNSTYTSYNTKQNGDFATTKGVEVQFTMRRYNRLSGSASLSFQDARGTGSSPDGNAGIVGAPLDGVTIFRPNTVTPLTFNKPLKGSFFLDYRFGVDDGPAILEQTGFTILGTFSSGHPFTRGIGSGEDLENQPRFRTAIEPPNSSITPTNFNIDLKIDKSFNIVDNFVANIYLRVLNLFDAKNVEEVYVRTGTAEDDGYLYDPNGGDSKVAQYGEDYRKLYKAVNIDYNGFYGNARQILLGIRLEY